MSETELIKRPAFNDDIQVQIKTLGEITSNIEQVKKYAINLKDYYSKLVFSEENISIAKDEKAKINKFKTQVSTYRKDIVKQFNEPINSFETLGKETEKILAETYDFINNQVILFEDKAKEEKRKEVEIYFNEYKKSLNIDFITLDNAKINITKNASLKSLKQQAKEYIDKVSKDLELINLQQYKEEILIEYKQTLDVSKSITSVLNRKEQLKRELDIKERQENEIKEIQNNLNRFVNTTQIKSTDEKEIEVLEPPTEEKIENKKTELLTTIFTLKGSLEQLKAIKEFIKNNCIEVLSSKENDKVLTLDVIYDEDEYVGENSQFISNDEHNIHFEVNNLDECPEDAIIGRNLFVADDYINTLNKGIELAQKGFKSVIGNYIKEKEEE